MRRSCMKKNFINLLRAYKWLILGIILGLSSRAAFSMNGMGEGRAGSSQETSEEKQKRFKERAALRLAQAAKLELKAERLAQGQAMGSTSFGKVKKTRSSKVKKARRSKSKKKDVSSVISTESSALKVTKADDDGVIEDPQMTEHDVKPSAWIPDAQDPKAKRGFWEKVSTQDVKMKQISVGSDDHVWAVSDDDKVYQKVDGVWTLKGDGISVAAAHDGTVYVIHADTSVAQFVNDQWEFVKDLRLSSITVGNKKNVWGVLDNNGSHDIYTLNGDKWEKALGADGRPAEGLKTLVVNDELTMLALDADGKVFMRTAASKKKVEEIESTRAEVVKKSKKRINIIKQKIRKIKAKNKGHRTQKQKRQLGRLRVELRELEGIRDGHKAISRKRKQTKREKLRKAGTIKSSSVAQKASPEKEAMQQGRSIKKRGMTTKKRTSSANDDLSNTSAPSKRSHKGAHKKMAKLVGNILSDGTQDASMAVVKPESTSIAGSADVYNDENASAAPKARKKARSKRSRKAKSPGNDVLTAQPENKEEVSSSAVHNAEDDSAAETAKESENPRVKRARKVKKLRAEKIDEANLVGSEKISAKEDKESQSFDENNDDKEQSRSERSAHLRGSFKPGAGSLVLRRGRVNIQAIEQNLYHKNRKRNTEK